MKDPQNLTIYLVTEEEFKQHNLYKGWTLGNFTERLKRMKEKEGKNNMAHPKIMNRRMVKTLAEANKGKTMTRKVDTYEYEALAECISKDLYPTHCRIFY